MPVIDKLLSAFERGDVPAMDALVADDLDLRIEHYRDDADISWQRSTDKAGFFALLQRLASDIFPRGTKVLSIDTRELGGGWTATSFRQRFFYAARDGEVNSQTWIIAHEADGRCDYFREIVATVEDAA